LLSSSYFERINDDEDDSAQSFLPSVFSVLSLLHPPDHPYVFTNSCFSFSFLFTARWNYLTLSYLRLAPQSYYLCSFYTSFHVACASVICVLKYLPTYLIIHSPFTVPVISSFSVDLRLSSSTTPESSVPDNLSLPAYIRLQRNR